MRLLTAEQLVDAVDQDRVWRIREISALKSIANSNTRPLSERLAVSRAGVAIAYSHWEGFVKRSADRYLEHVSLQRKSLDQLTGNFQVLYFRKLLSQPAGMSQFKSEQLAIQKIYQDRAIAPRLPYKDICHTFGNLGSSTFAVILEILGLEPTCYDLEMDYLDKQIVKRRNLIAHGSSKMENTLASVDTETFLEVSDRAVGLISTFGSQVQNAAVERSYICA